MEGGRVRPSYGQGRYGVVPPRVPDIAVICVLLIQFLHHTFGRRHPRRLSPNTAIVEEHGDDHSGSKPSRCALSLERTFLYGHHGKIYTPHLAARVEWEV